jgi:hypothetical protein
MIATELFFLPVVLALTVGAGIVAHEITHAVTLWMFEIPYRFEWAPNRQTAGVVELFATGTLARVEPQLSTGVHSHQLRIAAMMPLVLATPLLLVGVGVLPNPFVSGNLSLQVLLVGWTGCAIPSPQDFSLFWHAEGALAADTQGEQETDSAR